MAPGLGVHERSQLGHPSFADQHDPGWPDDAMHHVLLSGEGHCHVNGPLLLVEQRQGHLGGSSLPLVTQEERLLGAPLEGPHAQREPDEDTQDDPQPQRWDEQADDEEHDDAQHEATQGPPDHRRIDLTGELETLLQLLHRPPILGIGRLLAALLLGLGLCLLLGCEFLCGLALGHGGRLPILDVFAARRGRGRSGGQTVAWRLYPVRRVARAYRAMRPVHASRFGGDVGPRCQGIVSGNSRWCCSEMRWR